MSNYSPFTIRISVPITTDETIANTPLGLRTHLAFDQVGRAHKKRHDFQTFAHLARTSPVTCRLLFSVAKYP